MPGCLPQMRVRKKIRFFPAADLWTGSLWMFHRNHICQVEPKICLSFLHPVPLTKNLELTQVSLLLIPCPLSLTTSHQVKSLLPSQFCKLVLFAQNSLGPYIQADLLSLLQMPSNWPPYFWASSLLHSPHAVASAQTRDLRSHKNKKPHQARPLLTTVHTVQGTTLAGALFRMPSVWMEPWRVVQCTTCITTCSNFAMFLCLQHSFGSPLPYK